MKGAVSELSERFVSRPRSFWKQPFPRRGPCGSLPLPIPLGGVEVPVPGRSGPAPDVVSAQGRGRPGHQRRPLLLECRRIAQEGK
ncbi:unnamed protein product [Ixodes persulcatus]